MTSRRAAGAEGSRDPRSPGRSSGNDGHENPKIPPAQPVQIAGQSRQQTPLVPPPVPPRTPKSRQLARVRRPAPPVPTSPRPRPPPVPARPAASVAPAPVPVAQPPSPPAPPRVSTEQQEDNVFVEGKGLVGQTFSLSVEEPEEAANSQSERPSDEDSSDDDPPTVLFAKCARSASTQRSQDEDEDEDEIVAEDTTSPGDEPGTSANLASRNQSTARLRPPLSGTAGVSADSGTGDTGSAEVPIDSVGTPVQQPPFEEQVGNIGECPRAEQEADDGEDAMALDDHDFVMDVIEELQGLRRRRMVDGDTPDSVRLPAVKIAKHQVKPFTKDSRDRQGSKHVQLVKEYGFQPKRKNSVEDGGVLPNKFEPFPSNLYGRPLEEIDTFIYDEVSHFKLFLQVPFLFVEKKCHF